MKKILLFGLLLLSCYGFATSHPNGCVDTEKPVVMCNNGLTLAPYNINSDGCVEVPLTDLFQSVTDDCASQEILLESLGIRRQGTADTLSKSIYFCCVDKGINVVELWATDAEGNSNFDVTYVSILDTICTCADSNCGDSFSRIAGCIHTINDENVKAEMSFEDNTSGMFYESEELVRDGCYFFDVKYHSNFTVKPSLDVTTIQGVSGVDLYLLVSHLLGDAVIMNPYLLIAADVNNDQKINVKDVVSLRKVILHIDEKFSNNTSWRFFDVSKAITNPFEEELHETITLNDIVSQVVGSFVAVKIGDLNLDACANGCLTQAVDKNRSLNTLELLLDDQILDAEQSYVLEIKAKDFKEIAGFQFTLNYDKSALRFDEIIGGALTMNKSNIGDFSDKGILTCLWTAENLKDIDDNQVLFGLKFSVKKSNKLSKSIYLNSRLTNAEAFTKNLDPMSVKLRFTPMNFDHFDLLQNSPNPFNSYTTIGFVLPETSSINFVIYDIAGRILKQINADYEKGYHEINVSRDELSKGVLYYQLSTEQNTSTKKMILVR